jgi:excisionase family DNA binding protein
LHDLPVRAIIMKLLLAAEAAAMLRVTENRVYELAKRGMLPCVRLGRQIRFDEEAVLAWLRAGGTPLGETSRPEWKVVDSSLRRTQRG